MPSGMKWRLYPYLYQMVLRQRVFFRGKDRSIFMCSKGLKTTFTCLQGYLEQKLDELVNLEIIFIMFYSVKRIISLLHLGSVKHRINNSVVESVLLDNVKHRTSSKTELRDSFYIHFTVNINGKTGQQG